MEPYILLLLFVFFVIFVQEKFHGIFISFSGRKYDVIPFFTYLVFLLFYAARDHIGYDYQMYYATVEGGYADSVYGSKGEWISAGLLDLAGYVGEPYFFFFMTAAISLFLIIYSLYHYSPYKAGLGWGLLAFMAIPLGFIYTLSTQRQFVAIGIMMFGTQYLMYRKFLKFTVTSILASMAHISSCFCYLLYFIQTRFVSKKVLFVLGILGGIAMTKAAVIVGVLFPFYIQYIEGSVGASGGGTTQYFLYLAIMLFSLAVYPFVQNKQTYNFFLKNYMFGFLVMSLLFSFDASVSFRLGGFALLNAVFLIPLWFSGFSKTSRFIFKGILLIALSFLYFYGLATTDGDFYIPYKTFLW